MATAALKTELERLRAMAAARDPEPPAAPVEPATTAGAVAALASELAHALRRSVDYYREIYGLSLPEAVARSAEQNPAYEDKLLQCPPDELNWRSLVTLYQRDPECALRRWQEVVEAARQERRSGHHGARVVQEYCGHSWERAQFLALRAELAEAWRPRDAQEWLLIDQLAQFQTATERWQNTLASYTNIWDRKDRGRRKDEDKQPELPRVFIADAVEQAASMVERMHRLYLQTLKALQDRRRGAPMVVHRAAQVNVGGQQVNVCGGG